MSYEIREGFRIYSKSGRILGFYFTDEDGKRRLCSSGMGFPKNLYFDNKEDLRVAIQWRKKKIESLNVKHLRIQEMTTFVADYAGFEKLTEDFEEYIRDVRKHSHLEDASRLKTWVLRFFLDECKEPDISEWFHFFRQYKGWLSEQNSLRATKTGKLSKSTQVKCVQVLNLFFRMLEEEKGHTPYRRCPMPYKTHEQDARTIDDVVVEVEFGMLREYFGKGSDLDDLLMAFWSTGMRLNEVKGLSFHDVNFGKLDSLTHGAMIEQFKKVKIKPEGYIVLVSQPKLDSVVDVFGKVPRKPLKGKDRIAHVHARYIPILSEEFGFILDSRMDVYYNTDGDKSNKLLFSPALFLEFERRLRAFYELHKQFKPKTPHCFRHSFSTRFCGLIGGNLEVTRQVLGHRSIKTTERYVHLNDELAIRNQSANSKRFVPRRLRLSDD